jgi:hypothetical protein
VKYKVSDLLSARYDFTYDTINDEARCEKGNFFLVVSSKTLDTHTEYTLLSQKHKTLSIWTTTQITKSFKKINTKHR